MAAVASLAGRPLAKIVWLATRYPAMPDVELLDKLLTPDTVLLTRDGVLHNRALAQGVRSFTLNAHGQLTRTPLPLASRRVRVPAPSVLPQLKASYTVPFTVALSANQPPRVLKAQRTRRRRIRSTFGSSTTSSPGWPGPSGHSPIRAICSVATSCTSKAIVGCRACGRQKAMASGI